MRSIAISVLVVLAGCGNTKVHPDGSDLPDGGGGPDAAAPDALDLPDAPPGMGTVAVTPSGSGDGTVRSTPAGIDCGTTCAATFLLGTDVTLTATAAPGSVFAGWSDGGCAGTADCTVTVDGLVTVTATFVAQYTLMVTRTGSGTVTSSPGGIDCGTDCSEVYDDGTMVTLTAAAATGSTFSGWSGACTGAGACTVTVSAATGVTATFTPEQHVLMVTRNGTGTGTVSSSPGGISCGTDCAESYAFGTMVTLTPSGTGFSLFAGWSGACSGTGACTVTMTAARNVTATFNVQQFTLNVGVIDAQGLGALHVTSNVGGIDCYDFMGTCAATYNGGTVVILSSHIPANETFNGWLGACSGAGPTCTLTMDANKSTTLRTQCNGPCL